MSNGKTVVKQSFVVDASHRISYEHTEKTPTSKTIESGVLRDTHVSLRPQSTITYGDNYRDWSWRLDNGYQATTSLTVNVQRAKVTPGLLNGVVDYILIADPSWETIWSFEGYGLFTTQSLFSSTAIPTDTSTATNRALARFNEKAAAVNRQFQGGVVLAEIEKTLHGLRHPAEALFKGIETYSRAAMKLRTRFVKNRAHYRSLGKAQRRQVAKSFSEAASGLWLEQSFHWLPLTYDIRGAISALEASFDQTHRQFVKASANDVQSEFTSSGSGLVSFVQLPFSVNEKVGVSVRMYGSVRVRPRLPYWPDMASLGFDLRSFVPTIWELIPYSWAVDYFTNIGDIIYGMSQGGSEVAWAAIGSSRYVRRALKAQACLSPDAKNPPPGYKTATAFLVCSPSEAATETAILSRAPYNGSFIPDLEWKVPGMSLKWLNLGAAFLQRSLAFL